MKKSFILFALLFPALFLFSQEKSKSINIALKWAPTGLILGNVSLHGEYNFGKNSLTAKIGIPISTHRTLEYDNKDANFTMKATSFLAGYRTYLSKKHMRGIYFEPYFKYVHHSSEGIGQAFITGETVSMNFNNDYNGVGMGAQLGVQFLVMKKMIIDFFFFGPEINSARNNFKAIEISNAIPWTSTQGKEAEQDIRDFIDQFPFVRKKVNIMVDQNNKTVRADFKGALPGYRIGVSFGIAF